MHYAATMMLTPALLSGLLTTGWVGFDATKKEDEQSDGKKEDKKKKFPHRGLVLEANGGVAGCVRAVCGGDLDPAVGGRFGGFLGWNFLGFIEFGAEVNYAMMKLRGAGNPLRMHRIDPTGFAGATVGSSTADQYGDDLEALTVDGGKGRMLNAGLALRIHIIPRGRWVAFLGTGIGYNHWDSAFDTPDGDVRIRLPGVSFPFMGAFGYYVLKHLALNLQFQYTLTTTVGARVDAPGYDKQFAFTPILEDDGAVASAWQKDLPDLWTVLLGVRFHL